MILPALLASTAIILLSFVSEDAATISSASSIFGGPMGWPLGFASCFFGIWLGDLGLYTIARCTGKNVLRSRWLARLTEPGAIERCEKTFGRNRTLALVASRFIPGTRLPTYLAAGLFRMPVGPFAIITALAALLWISGIFALTKFFGSRALLWFTFAQGKIAAVVVTGLVLFLSIYALRKLLGYRAALRRWRHWEFWPACVFYIPVGIYYLWLALRYRSLTLPTAANPGIATGGLVGESKIEILRQLQSADPELVADAYLLEGETTADQLLCLGRLCRQHQITLPFILKPDVGQRGNGVRLVQSWSDALDYVTRIKAPVILQRYAPGRYEAGIFYFRFPDETRGRIFSITDKNFPSLTGDGVHTIEELIRADTRASIIAHTYLRRFAHRRDEILPAGESLKLVETGNHAQGCIFRDGERLWTQALEEKIDRLSHKLDGFYIGRFDLRYDDEDEFRAGRNFKIVELNGASSEATNIYDSRNSLRSAYKVLFHQWSLVFAIGAANRARGHTTSRLTTLWKEWRRYSSFALSYPSAS